jgi:hypothetical protein
LLWIQGVHPLELTQQWTYLSVLPVGEAANHDIFVPGIHCSKSINKWVN